MTRQYHLGRFERDVRQRTNDHISRQCLAKRICGEIGDLPYNARATVDVSNFTVAVKTFPTISDSATILSVISLREGSWLSPACTRELVREFGNNAPIESREVS
jgi:hypothetical protein